jgi:hypothetical protein
MAPHQNYIHVQASTATINKNTGIQSAITNGTPVPPPQARTTPLDGGGPAEQQKTDGRLAAARSDSDNNDPRSGIPELQQSRPQGGRCCDLALAHADARGARTSTKSRRPEARMVAVTPSATGTSRAASALAPAAGAISPPVDPHSNPPGRVGHRPPRGGAIPAQRQDHPRTRTPP